MQFTFKVWRLIVEINIFDIDPTDKDVELGIRVSW